ncbi:hypothetical protein DFJ77DRAFT_69108 [Powellomyces hirtus]|nr:hypothetical protein DFJ77DRAFT_69108 [Powellomyces hirtus]
MSRSAALLLALVAINASFVQSHMMVSHPAVWGGQDYSLENPLNMGSKNWMCAGRKPSDGKGAISFNSGGRLGLPIVCGAAAKNPGKGKEICQNDPSAFHKGGGCLLSIAYKANPKPEDFVVISSVHDCPNGDYGTINFNMPELPACDDCVCAWNWISKEATDEMYMNCFDCKILGGKNGTITGGTHLSDHYYAVPGYPAKGRRPLYENTVPNGAVPVGIASVVPLATVSNITTPLRTNTTANGTTSGFSPSSSPRSPASATVSLSASAAATGAPDNINIASKAISVLDGSVIAVVGAVVAALMTVC